MLDFKAAFHLKLWSCLYLFPYHIWGGGNVLTAQPPAEIEFCGSFSRVPHAVIPMGDEAPLYYDRFGNEFFQYELIQAGGDECGTSTFLVPVFSETGGAIWTLQERETICAVFNYVESLMNYAGPPLNISVVKTTALTGYTLATGSPVWSNANCGLTNTTLNEAMLGIIFPTDFNHGIISIGQNTNWHTLSEDGPVNPDLAVNEYDLYTATLHEVLHVLGFASRISSSGGPVSSTGTSLTFSKWDSFLYQMSDSPPTAYTLTPLILPNPSNYSCCNPYVFNNTHFSPMPDALSGTCDLLLTFSSDGITPLAPVNSTEAEVNDIGNRLSHLQINCKADVGITNVEQYVMHPKLAEQETRRILTPTELEILCQLGFPVTSEGCSNTDPCISYVPDLFYTIILSQTPTLVLSSNDLLLNVEPNNLNQLIDELPDCGLFTNFMGQIGLTVSFNNDEFTLTALAPGNYNFCYVVNCDDQCETGTVNILVMSDFIPMQCVTPECNLVCYGDFEAFTPGTNAFNTQIGQYFNQFGYPQGVNTLTPDIGPLYTTGLNNQYLLLATYQTVVPGDEPFDYREYGSLPLSQPIADGCSVTIKFKASSNSTVPLSTTTIIKIFAVNESPLNCTPFPTVSEGIAGNYPEDFIGCPIATAIPLCDAMAYPITDNLTYCGIEIPTNPPVGFFDNPAAFQTYTHTWTNNTGEPISHLLIMPDAIFSTTTGESTKKRYF